MLLPYQDEYVKHTKESLGLGKKDPIPSGDFEVWFSAIQEKSARSARLKQRNMEILNSELFPLLDNLHAATEEQIKSLEEFADVLLDWKNNLDRGICVTIPKWYDKGALQTRNGTLLPEPNGDGY